MKQFLILFVLVLSLSACKKNLSVFWEDDDARDLAIFSDTGNNIMSCYVNGNPFSTLPRNITYSFPGSFSNYEVEVNRHQLDSVSVKWHGRKTDNSGNPEESITVVFYLNKNFTIGEFNALSGQRLNLDGNNGYFLMKSKGDAKGTGNIYFHKAEVNFVNGKYEGSIAGLFDARFPDVKITKGRFDHYLPQGIFGL